MAIQEVKLPKLGESIKEATILNWLKKEGEQVEQDEVILEVATDKVDSEVVAPESGVLLEILYDENELVAVGETIAKIDTGASAKGKEKSSDNQSESKSLRDSSSREAAEISQSADAEHGFSIPRHDQEGRFYSPLVRSMAEKESISAKELQAIEGSGTKGRVLKKDLLTYLKNRDQAIASEAKQQAPVSETDQTAAYQGRHEIVEMDRMRGMIADHMVQSKRVSPHVTSYVEVDVTKLVEWRTKNKAAFYEKYGEKITFTPIFVEAVVAALKEYPMVNISIDDKKLIVKKDINIGLATALPSGNLIVPVIKNAEKKNLLGLASSVNDLVGKARNNKLSAKEVEGSTFTISNVGTFRNVMGTPIINQPEVAILATGVIRKKPVVVETEYGDVITVRQMMYLSLSYDHRAVDGNLGGSFLARIMDHLEAFDENRAI